MMIRGRLIRSGGQKERISEEIYTNYRGELAVDVPKTAFGDARTAELTPLIQHTFEYDIVNNTELIENHVSGSGSVTHDATNSLGIVSTGTTTGSNAEMHSKRHARYRGGLGGLARFTAIFTTPVAGTKQAIGLFDENYQNGYGIGYNGLDFGVVRIYNGDQNWITGINLDDPLGTIASEPIKKSRSNITLNPTKGNVFYVSYQFLGFGGIEFGIELNETRQLIPFHLLTYANKNTQPTVKNPNFHLSMWVENGATTSDISIKTASMMAGIEGKTKYWEVHQPQQSASASLTTSTQSQVLSIRNKSSYTGVDNTIDILLENFSYSTDGTKTGLFKILKNPTLGGVASWTDVNTTDSIVEEDIAQTTVSDEGKVIIPIATDRIEGGNIDLTPYEIIIAPGEEVTITFESTANSDVQASLLWKELM